MFESKSSSLDAPLRKPLSNGPSEEVSASMYALLRSYPPVRARAFPLDGPPRCVSGSGFRFLVAGAATGILSISLSRDPKKSVSCSAETTLRYALIEGTTGGGGGFALALAFVFASFLVAENSFGRCHQKLRIRRTFRLPPVLIALCLFFLLLEVIHPIVHVAPDAIVYNEVIFREASSNNRFVLIFSDLVVNGCVFFKL